jgi:hypothetical protein
MVLAWPTVIGGTSKAYVLVMFSGVYMPYCYIEPGSILKTGATSGGTDALSFGTALKGGLIDG